MNRNIIIPAIFLIVVFLSCNSANNNKKKPSEEKKSGQKTLFTSLSPFESGIRFSNTLTETDSENYFTYNYLYTGAGVAAGDINNDGLTDIFFAGNQVPCRLYLNKGKLQFEDITLSSMVHTNGWCTGVSFVDVNSDGWLDIYVCRSYSLNSDENRRNLLFINNHDLTFTESAKNYGLDDPGYSTQAYFFDADNDGDLDMYLVNHRVVFMPKLGGMLADKANLNPVTNHKFYLNMGNNRFKDDTQHSGLQCDAFGLSASIADLNNDGYLDIYASNDYIMPDFIYINNKDGTFSDETDSRIKHMCEFSMGADIADFNNDGFYDIYTLDMLPEDNYRHKMLFPAMNYDKYIFRLMNGYRHQRMQNCLQLNNGNGTFNDIALMAGVARTDWSWSALFVDLDNDGWKDIYVTNGFLRDVTNLDFAIYRSEEMRKHGGVENRTTALLNQMSSTPLKNYAFQNNKDLRFINKTDAWGFKDKTFSYGVTYADLDNDGDMDLIVNNLIDTASVYINHCDEIFNHHFLKIKFTGNDKNKFGIGTEVTLFHNKSLQRQLVMPARGYESSVDYILNFGLGEAGRVDSLIVKWPDGKMQKIVDVKANQLLTLNQTDAFQNNLLKPNQQPPLFILANDKYACNFTHKENPFIDFKREPLLPHQFSQSGPFIATGDVNGDSRTDFFIGNAKGSAGKMFLQNADGKFSENKSRPWDQDKMQEDMGCLLFDADGDKDLDLYVVSGGSEEERYNDYYQDRLYLNDGKGNFTKCKNCLPKINSSGSCVAAADYDNDGDLDLFRGGKISPSRYPQTVNSYLLRNDKGKFTDVISEIAPDLAHPGILNAAVWDDFNNDHKPDLVVAGEWMPVMFFENQNGKLVWINNTQESQYTKGWWSSIAAHDFDNDGDVDFIAGNYGLNSKLNAAVDKPLTIVAKDFDGNGTLDAILNNYVPDGKRYPIYSRDDITDQIRPLKKKLLRYADYAGKTIEEIFPTETFNDVTLYCYHLESCYIENKGRGVFKFHPLPVQAQTSPVYGIIISDFNGDNHSDVLLAGNSYAENVELGFCDAGMGTLLQGDGKGNFISIPNYISGFTADRNVKHLAHIKIANGNKEIILVANNNDALQLFEINSQRGVKIRGTF